MNPSVLTRGGVVALLMMVGCHQKANAAECEALIDKYAELVVREQFPDAGPDAIAKERARERTEAKTDVLKNCPSEVQRDALAMLSRDDSGIKSYQTEQGELSVFFESYAPPPTMYIVGAVHIAIPLVTYAKTLGFRTVVVDARGAFATSERFAHADELIGYGDTVLTMEPSR